MNPRQPNWRRVELPAEQRGVRPPQFPVSGPPAGMGQSGAQATTSLNGPGGQPSGQHQAQASMGTRQAAAPVEGTATPQQPQGTVGAADAGAPTATAQPPGGRVGTPSIDLLETEEEYLILLDMAGFEEEHMTIQADDEGLLVTAERTDELGESTTRAHVRERPVRVQRRLDLPVGADVEGATASHENGVCTVTIPRTSEGDKRTIGFQ